MIVACVRTGDKFGPEYVERLVRGVQRHSAGVHCKFICLTDQRDTYPGVENVPIKGLPGWWGKMELFNPDWRKGRRLVYLDLDTVVNGSLYRLLTLDVQFAICRNFTRAIKPVWPCSYGSCVIALGANYGRSIYDEFMASRDMLMRIYAQFGDQRVIEHLDESAKFLQDLLPREFFSHYRSGFRTEAALLIFGGACKPHTHATAWVREKWLGTDVAASLA